jgi:hypothetical protein
MRDYDSIVKKDVVVIGGGSAGMGAAIAAARNGADTLLIERYQYLGGMMTGGLVHGFHTVRVHQNSDYVFESAGGENTYQTERYQLEQVVRGLAMEMLERLYEMGGVYGLYGKPGEAASRTHHDPTALKLLADQMVKEAGVELWLDSLATEPVIDGDRLAGIVVHNKSGKHHVMGKVFVDCSGDGDIAARSGVPFDQGREEDGRPEASTLIFIMGGVDLQKTLKHLEEHPEDRGRGDIEEWRRIFEKGRPIFVGGFRNLLKKAYANGDLPLPMHSDVPGGIGTFKPLWRGGRLVPSETIHNADMAYKTDPISTESLTETCIFARWYVMRLANFFMKYVPGFEDSHLIETANQLGVRESRRIIGEYVLCKEDILESREFDDAIARGGRAMDVHSEVGGQPGHWVEIRSGKAYDIPYRCLIPKAIEGLLVAGRCISVDHMALGSVRGIPLCIATGQAAGTAAAIAARDEIIPRKVDIFKLQRNLVSQGVNLGVKADKLS